MSEGWFCKVGDKKVGPLSADQLKTIAAQGQLRPEHMVRRGSEGPWVPAGRVKGLFPQKPAAKPVARPMNLPTAQAGPQPPASDVPAEFALGGGHKHHVVMDVDKLHIDAEPVMVSNRKTHGLPGLKKGEQQKLTMILLGIIGGGLAIAVIVFVVALTSGKLSGPKEEPKKEEAAKLRAEETKKAADAKAEKEKENERVKPKEEDKWTRYPEHVRRKQIEVRLDPAPCESRPPRSLKSIRASTARSCW